MQQCLTLCLCTVLLAGCASFPELDTVVSEEAKRAAYPSLIPAKGLLDRREQGQLTATSGAQLLARADRLRARARIIRNITAVDEATRLRIAGRLRRLGG